MRRGRPKGKPREEDEVEHYLQIFGLAACLTGLVGLMVFGVQRWSMKKIRQRALRRSVGREITLLRVALGFESPSPLSAAVRAAEGEGAI